jgi:hypothetical protein
MGNTPNHSPPRWSPGAEMQAHFHQTFRKNTEKKTWWPATPAGTLPASIPKSKTFLPRARRSDRHANYLPNCPPTSVLLVLKMKFLVKNICFVLKEIAGVVWFGSRSSLPSKLRGWRWHHCADTTRGAAARPVQSDCEICLTRLHGCPSRAHYDMLMMS